MINEIFFINTGINANYLRYEVKEIMTFYFSIPFKTTMEGENLKSSYDSKRFS